MCGGRGGNGTGSSPSISVVPCQYHSITATYSFSSTCCFYQTDKRAKPGNLPIKSNVLSEFGERWTEKYFYPVFKSLNNKAKITTIQRNTECVYLIIRYYILIKLGLIYSEHVHRTSTWTRESKVGTVTRLGR
jgi:hypothetical protein